MVRFDSGDGFVVDSRSIVVVAARVDQRYLFEVESGERTVVWGVVVA